MTTINPSTMGIYEAKTHFASVIERVMAGQVITITKHGKPVAKIAPIDDVSPNPTELLTNLAAIRKFTVTSEPYDIRTIIGRDEH